MDTLPDSLLLSIFSFLGYDTLCLGVRMCCLKWRSLSVDPALWRRVDVPSHFSDKRLYMLLEQVHPYVEVLEMSQCDNITASGFLTISDLFFPRLKQLSVPIAGHLNDKIFVKLAGMCPKLEELENVSPNFDDTCNPLLCQMLFKSIKVVHDRPVTTFGRIRMRAAVQSDETRRTTWSKYLEKFADTSDNVNQIEAYKCSRGMGFLDEAGIVRVGNLFPNIRHLEIRHCSINNAGLQGFFCARNYKGLFRLIMDKPGDDICDDGLKLIADYCPDLFVLKLSRCPNVTSIGIQYLVSKCHNIVELHLNNSSSYLDPQLAGSDIDDACLSVIGENCVNLLSFRLFYSSKVTSLGLGNLLQKCHRLHGLMLFQCSQINDTCLKIIERCPHLLGLILVNCEGVTPQALMNLIIQSPKLSTLTFFTKEKNFLKDVNQLSEDVFQEIDAEDSHYHPNVIQRLTLRGVGSSFLQLITVMCPNLKLLDLREGCLVSSNSIISVLESCEQLKELDISFCHLSDRQLLDGIASHGASLSRLSLGGCGSENLKDELCSIIASCPMLKMIALDLSEWSNLNIDQVVEFAKKHHGGNAHLYYEKGFQGDDGKSVELLFTPIKYLDSVPGSKIAASGIDKDDVIDCIKSAGVVCEEDTEAVGEEGSGSLDQYIDHLIKE